MNNTKDIDKVIKEIAKQVVCDLQLVFLGDRIVDEEGEKEAGEIVIKALKNQKDYYEGIIKEMIGEEEKLNKEDAYSTDFRKERYNVRFGHNAKRQEIINITKKYNI